MSKGTDMRGLVRTISVLAVVALTWLGSVARGESVRTVDDKIVSGTISSFAAGELSIQPKLADAAVVKMPIAEIVEISLHPPAAKPQPANKPVNSPTPGGSSFANMLGTFLGLSSGPAADAAPDSSGSSDPPDSGDESEPSEPATPSPALAQPIPVPDPPMATGAPAAGAAPTLVATAPTYSAAPAGAYSAAPAAAPAAASKVQATVAHAKGPLWRIEFGATDHVTAAMTAGSSNHIKLSLDGAGATSLELPVDQLREIWSSNETLVKKARDLKVSAAGQDVAFVEKSGDVKSVAGVMLGIDGDSLTFKYEGEDRKIKLDRLVGVTLAQRETTPDRSLHEAFLLVNGDLLSGKLEAIEHGTLRMKPLAAGESGAAPLEIPLPLLATVEIKNGRLTWLGDLVPASVSQVPYFDRLMPYRVNQSLTGGPLVLADGSMTKGIAVHSKSVLAYDINGGYERFKTKVGFQQPEGKAGRAPVRIVGDDKVLWHDDNLKGDAGKPVAVDLDVAGVKRLTLEADFGPNQDVGGRVVWGEARLVKAAPK
jgi:hypothetical protein